MSYARDLRLRALEYAQEGYSLRQTAALFKVNIQPIYYKDSKRKPIKAQVGNDELDSKILKVYYESKRYYGVLKIFNVIRNEDQTARRKRLQRRMADLGMKSVVIKKYKPVRAEINIEQKENIMNRDCTAASITIPLRTNQSEMVHGTSRTFIPKRKAERIKSSVEDVYSRKIISWHLAKSWMRSLYWMLSETRR